MLDEHDAAAELVPDPQQQPAERLDLALGHTGPGFVEQQQRRLVTHHTGELHDAPGAGGEVGHEDVTVRLEAEQPEELVHAGVDDELAVVGGRQPQGVAHRVAHVDGPVERHGDRLGDHEPGEEATPLEGAPEPESGPGGGRRVDEVCSTETDRAAVERLVAADEVEDRRLAGTVLPDEPDHLAGRHVERDVVDGDHAAEASGGTLERQDRGGAVDASRGGTTGDGARCRWGRDLLEEHRPQQVGPLEQFPGGTREPDPAPLHEVRRRRELQGDVDGLLDEQHRGPSRGDLPHQFGELPDDDRRQAQAELVDHQELRFAQQRHAQTEHLLLAAREVRRGLVEPFGEDRERGQHLLGPPTEPFGIPPQQPPGGPQVLPDGQAREHRCATGNLTDTEPGDLARRRVGDVPPVQDDGAEVRLGHPGHGPQERRLAGAVGAEQRDDLALRHLHVHVEQDLHPSVAHVEVVHDQQLRATRGPVHQSLGAGGRGVPDIGDVPADHLPARGDHQAADGQHRGHDEHPLSGAERVAHPADRRQQQQTGDRPPRGDGEPDRPGARRDGERERGEQSREQDREDRGERDVGHDGHPQRRGEGEHGGERRADQGDPLQEVEHERRITQEQTGPEPGPDRQSEQLERLDQGGQVAALELVELVHLLVEEARQRHESDERHGEEGRRVPDASEDVDLPHEAPRLAETGGRLLGLDGCGRGAGRPALLGAPDGIPHPGADDHEQHRRDGEQEERRPPAEGVGERPGEQRPGELPDHVGRPVEREHGRSAVDGVVVRQQRVVGGRDDGGTDPGTDAGDHQHPQGHGGAGHDREGRPHQGPEQGDDDPVAGVGPPGDRELQQQRAEPDECQHRQDTGVGEPEGVTDVR